MAAQHFKGEDPIGRRIRFMQPPPSPGQPQPGGRPEAKPPVWRTIVGIVPTIRHGSPQDAEPPSVVYTSYRQVPPTFAWVMVRSAMAPTSVLDAVRRTVSTIDPDQPVFNLRTIDEMLRQQMWPYRVFGSLFAIFALIGLLLSSVGLYAVVAYSVTQRTQEIGVRMALGAQGSQVTWMILRRGLVQLALGLVIGLVGGYFAAKAHPSQIFVQTSSTDAAMKNIAAHRSRFTTASPCRLTRRLPVTRRSQSEITPPTSDPAISSIGGKLDARSTSSLAMSGLSRRNVANHSRSNGG